MQSQERIMNAKIIPVALALVLVTAGAAAAMPGNAPTTSNASESNLNSTNPAEPAADAPNDGQAEKVSERVMNGSDAAERVGPRIDLPEKVPDHVSEIHATINDYLEGALNGSLGDAISAITPSEDSNESVDDAEDSNESENDTAVESNETQSPDGESNADSQSPTVDENDVTAADSAESEDSENSSASNDQRGPAATLPAQVPDQVSTVHDTIRGFLDDVNTNLGNAVSGIVG